MQINVDLGEGGKRDELFMSIINSCSIAVGGHYGSIDTIKKTIRLAYKYGVNVGSHPSYPDKTNFGRVSIKMDLNKFQKSIHDQLLNFKKALNYFKLDWHHCKAHGALYNDLIHNQKLTTAYFEVLNEFSEINYLILPASKSIINDAEKMNFRVLKEIFSDRRYDKYLNLIPRKNANSMITDITEFSANLKHLLKGKIRVSNHLFRNVLFDSICLHSDSLMSDKFIYKMHEILNEEQIQ